MTKDDETESASDVVGARLRQLRKQRDLTIEEVADLCAKAGAPELTANALYLIEGGRRKGGRRTRKVTVDEVLALGAALGISPLELVPGAETVQKLLYDLALLVASAGIVDDGLIEQVVNKGRLSVEQMNTLIRVYKATAARRKAQREATKEAFDGE